MRLDYDSLGVVLVDMHKHPPKRTALVERGSNASRYLHRAFGKRVSTYFVKFPF
jgi:hypothetical protein